MTGARIVLGAVIGLSLFVAPSALAAPKPVLNLSAGSSSLAAGTEVSFTESLRPQGYQGHAEQAGAGPLSANDVRLDSVRILEGAAGQGGGWLVQGTIESITLSSAGKATIAESGEEIADSEVTPPPPSIPLSGGSTPLWECWHQLPKKLTGTFSTSGLAVISGQTKAKPSKACHLPGFSVSFTVELRPTLGESSLLQTSLLV
jgi:hypothetical protein